MPGLKRLMRFYNFEIEESSKFAFAVSRRKLYCPHHPSTEVTDVLIRNMVWKFTQPQLDKYQCCGYSNYKCFDFSRTFMLKVRPHRELLLSFISWTLFHFQFYCCFFPPFFFLSPFIIANRFSTMKLWKIRVVSAGPASYSKSPCT